MEVMESAATEKVSHVLRTRQDDPSGWRELAGVAVMLQLPLKGGGDQADP